MKSRPNFHYESRLWRQGASIVAGADEVGRGAFAGPVVAAVVAFSPNIKLAVEINDSKKLSPKKRELANHWIKHHALFWSIGQGSVTEINRFGIVKATHRAFRRAIHSSQTDINHLLLDAFYLPHTNALPQSFQTPIKKGDSLSISIAAASIIAKVHRDALMCTLHQRYQQYHWQANKGYGTLFHRQAIQAYGVCPYHRTCFIKNTLARASSPIQSDT